MMTQLEEGNEERVGSRYNNCIALDVAATSTATTAWWWWYNTGV